MFYACIEKKDGRIIKVPFEKREDARKYISDNWNEIEDIACWTE